MNASRLTPHASPAIASPAAAMQRDRRQRLARRLRLYRLRIRAYAGIVVCLVAISLQPAEDKTAWSYSASVVRLSCVRTYIPQPPRDAIRCTECQAHMADGSQITKEGC